MSSSAVAHADIMSAQYMVYGAVFAAIVIRTDIILGMLQTLRRYAMNMKQRKTMSEFMRLWLFYLSLSGFIRNAFKEDVYNVLMWGTAMVISLIVLKLC